MTERAPPPAHRLPPAWTLWPELRRPVAQLRVSARTLTELLLVAFPVAGLLARDRTIAAHANSTPYDHLAADTLDAVHQLVDALDELARPITLVAPSPTPSDERDF